MRSIGALFQRSLNDIYGNKDVYGMILNIFVMFKILQDRLQSSWTVNIQMFKLDLEKVEEPEIKLLTSIGS